jgi:uncharacterized membrane protein
MAQNPGPQAQPDTVAGWTTWNHVRTAAALAAAALLTVALYLLPARAEG